MAANADILRQALRLAGINPNMDAWRDSQALGQAVREALKGKKA